MMPRELVQEINRLDDEQRAIVTHPGNVVALAGPGAGKTRTIVARAGYLLYERLSKRQGLAAITFTTKSSQEIERRLRGLGIFSSRRMVSRTVHSFCLNDVIRPLGPLTGRPALTNTDLIDPNLYADLVEKALDSEGLLTGPVEYLLTRVSRTRRLAYAGETAGLDERWLTAVGDLDSRMREEGVIDFEAMAANALEILRHDKSIVALLAARMPHLIVDEYQDLGPILHAIVLTLLEQGVIVSAVGDPDQVMYGFDGADPRYLKQLTESEAFRTIPLRYNYRSGALLVAAGLEVLGEPRPYISHPDVVHEGDVLSLSVGPSLTEHADAAVKAAQVAVESGTAAEQVAILYPGKGPLLDEIEAQLASTLLPAVLERSRSIPPGPLAEFIVQCAARHLTGPLPLGADAVVTGDVLTVSQLATQLSRLREGYGTPDRFATVRQIGRLLVEAMDDGSSHPGDDPAAPFLESLITSAGLDALASHSSDIRDAAALWALGSEGALVDLTLAELAGARIPGRVVVTTYHSAKGREFDCVIIPGLCEGIVPRYTFNWATKQWVVTTASVAEARRNFYVAVTRARRKAVLISGTAYMSNGRLRAHGRTRFLDSMSAHLSR